MPPAAVKKDFRPGPTHGDFPLYDAFPNLKAFVFGMRKRIGNAPLVKYAPKRERTVPASWRFYPPGTRPQHKGEAIDRRAKDGWQSISPELAATFAQRFAKGVR